MDYWDQQKSKISIQPSNTLDAINVMTIHKAKGLEFPVVILPTAAWNLSLKSGVNGIMWSRLPEELGIPLPLIPLNITQNLNETAFKADYAKELMLTYVDNLNLLYVALTRAKSELYILGNQSTKRNVCNLLECCLDKMESELRPENFKKTEEYTIIGEPVKFGKDKTVEGFSEELRHEPDENSASHLKLKKRAPLIYSPNNIDVLERAHVGTILHEIFRQCGDLNEILNALSSKAREGELSEQEVSQLSETLSMRFMDDKVKQWFSPESEIIDEASICFPSNSGSYMERRPDKIIFTKSGVEVVDYKFGEEDTKHHKQVTSYMHLLKQMDYSNVTGFL